MTTISVYVDDVLAGSGTLKDGVIRDCGAQFCQDVRESDRVYDQIEEAIEASDRSITLQLDGQEKRITWVITLPL